MSSAKDTYDTQRTEIIQMAAKVTFLDRVLAAYGPEAADARAQFHDTVGEAVRRMWPDEPGAWAQLNPKASAGTPSLVSSCDSPGATTCSVA